MNRNKKPKKEISRKYTEEEISNHIQQYKLWVEHVIMLKRFWVRGTSDIDRRNEINNTIQYLNKILVMGNIPPKYIVNLKLIKFRSRN